MKNQYRIIHAKELILVSSEGELDLNATKSALRELTSIPEYTELYELLIDLRGVDCNLSVTDIYDIASCLAWPDPALTTLKKIAVLVQPGEPFDHAEFLELCANNRGMQIKAFSENTAAVDWLNSDVSDRILDS